MVLTIIIENILIMDGWNPFSNLGEVIVNTFDIFVIASFTDYYQIYLFRPWQKKMLLD